MLHSCIPIHVNIYIVITRYFFLSLHAPLSELLVMGGDSAKDQIRALQERVDIVSGTPGRLDDLISTGKLDLSGVWCFLCLRK